MFVFQDETSLTVGGDHVKVLADVGVQDVLYNQCGCSKEHITASVTITASGDVLPIRLVYKGTRNIAANKLKDMRTDGVTGKWGISLSERGWMTAKVFLDVLCDIVAWMGLNDIPHPIVVFCDGYAGHMGLNIAEFCLQFGVKLWRLKENTTHVTQVNFQCQVYIKL